MIANCVQRKRDGLGAGEGREEEEDWGLKIFTDRFKRHEPTSSL